MGKNVHQGHEMKVFTTEVIYEVALLIWFFERNGAEWFCYSLLACCFDCVISFSYLSWQNKSQPQFRSDYNVYSTFQSHEPEFDYLKSLEIEEKINKIRWLPQKNAAQFLLSTNGLSHFIFFLAFFLFCFFLGDSSVLRLKFEIHHIFHTIGRTWFSYTKQQCVLYMNVFQW